MNVFRVDRTTSGEGVFAAIQESGTFLPGGYETMKHLWWIVVAVTPVAIHGQIVGRSPNGSRSLTNDSSQRIASRFSGSDCGAKIDAADASLGTTQGEILVDQFCGMDWTTPVVLSTSHVLVFTQGGPYILHAGISVGQSACVIGSGNGLVWEKGWAATALVEAPESNLAALATFTGQNACMRNLELDGSKRNNPGASDVVYVNAARNVVIERCFIHDGKRYGIYAKSSTPSANDAAVVHITHSVVFNNGSDNIRLQDLTDAFVDHTEAEMGGGWGIYCLNCAGSRFHNGDFAQNAKGGLYLGGTEGGGGSWQCIVNGNQFGNNFQQDIEVDGWNGTSYSAVNEAIVGNHFFSRENLPDAIYPSILLSDTSLNSIAGNTFHSNTPHRYSAAIVQTTTGHSNSDSIVGNSYNGWYSAATTIFATAENSCGNSDGACTVLGALQLSYKNTTGSGSAALGANSPATVPTAPYTWFTLKAADGTTVYVPAWK